MKIKGFMLNIIIFVSLTIMITTSLIQTYLTIQDRNQKAMMKSTVQSYIIRLNSQDERQKILDLKTKGGKIQLPFNLEISFDKNQQKWLIKDNKNGKQIYMDDNIISNSLKILNQGNQTYNPLKKKK